MYKIIYVNKETNVRIIEYCFSRFARNRVFYLAQQDEWAEIEFVFKLCRTWNIFKKCWRNEVKYEKIKEN